LGDLGLAREICDITNDNKLTGTTIYMAPELVDGEEAYTAKIDIWAFGCVLYEIVCLKSAFTLYDKPKKIFDEILNKEPELPADYLSTIYATRFPIIRNILNNSLMKKVAAKRASANFLLRILASSADAQDAACQDVSRYFKGSCA
jgi:serine/threonine protein kinase